MALQVCRLLLFILTCVNPFLGNILDTYGDNVLAPLGEATVMGT